MGIAERREREKEALRTLIMEAARDILSEQGLDALSMRAIAERVEYSPATIYLYFRDKDELIRAVVHAGFVRMGEYMREEIRRSMEQSRAVEAYRAMGRAYARFALENTAYFRVMFELPSVPSMECMPCESLDAVASRDEESFNFAIRTLERAMDEGSVELADPRRGATVGWGLVHGLTSLYLGGHLADTVGSREEFLELVGEAQHSLYEGWRPRREEDTPVSETALRQTA
jgi:AcrR family transcriptional regulator